MAIGMLDRVPLFAGVAADTIARLEARLRVRRFAAGETILRAGTDSAALYGVIDGAVRVELGAEGGRRVLLVAPQCFGEMSALSGDPVSATVVAHRETRVWILATDDLMAELRDDGTFFRNVAAMLAQRLRHRTRPYRAARPRVVLLPVADRRDEALARHLHAGIAHYLPESALVDTRTHDLETGQQALAAATRSTVADAIVFALAGPEAIDMLAPTLRPDDLILDRGPARAAPRRADTLAWRWADDRPPARDARWCCTIDPARLDAAPGGRPVDPALDRLVRRLCGREIGFALSVGAAAGLAHLGLLEVLEDEGIPIDYLCGSSMGGAVALAYARFGRARAAIDAMARLAQDFSRDRGVSLMPRSSVLGADRITAITDELFGTDTFAQLGLPTAVVAADLVASCRTVIEQGPVAAAARATTAIPGLFAPVRWGHSILVDGGVCTRVPVDLLLARGCGCKIASLVYPDESSNADLDAAADQLEEQLDRPFGLRLALGGSWRLLGWWDSATQAERADLALRIPTPPLEGFNFAAAQEMVDCGRQAARRQIGAIRSVVRLALEPGTP
jgi:NTE family protein